MLLIRITKIIGACEEQNLLEYLPIALYTRHLHIIQAELDPGTDREAERTQTMGIEYARIECIRSQCKSFLGTLQIQIPVIVQRLLDQCTLRQHYLCTLVIQAGHVHRFIHWIELILDIVT